MNNLFLKLLKQSLYFLYCLVQMNLTIDVDTHVIHKSVNETKEEVQEGNKLGNDTKETVQNATAKPPFVFKDYPAEQQ